MTAIPQSAAAGAVKPISRRLLEPLQMVAGRAKVLAFLRAGFQWMVVSAAGWLVVVLLLGTLRDLPVWAAISLSILAWGLIVFGIARFFGGGRVFKTRDISSAARMVDVAMPAMQERISSAVELSQETDARFRGSPELVACLIRQAEKDADKLDPNLVVSGKSVVRWFMLLLPILAIWLVALIAETPEVFLGLQRTFKPWVSAPALPTATLEIEPGDLTVAEGESVTIAMTVKPPAGIDTPQPEADPRATMVRRFTTGSADQELASEMDRTGTHTFHAILDNVTQSFTYRINAAGVQSPIYTVTVQGRPAVANIGVDYIFPAYTKLPPRSEKSHEGSVNALLGTRVALTVESTQPLKEASFTLADNSPNPGTIPLLQVSSNPPKYKGEFTISRTTQYRIKLLNEQSLENKDNQPHAVVAILDQPPQIQIDSPVGTVKVRRDDPVPVKYTATDDFGVVRVEALLHLDDGPEQVALLPLVKPGEAKISDKWMLQVADVLKAAPGGAAGAAAAKRISYQLRATDNREPDAQTALSAKQFLEIDDDVAPLAQRLDAQAVRDLIAAVHKAEAQIAEAREKLDALQKADPAKPLDEKQKQAAADARQKIADARQQLAQAAEKAADTKAAPLAKEAQEIADNPLKSAEEKAAESQLAADQPDARKQSAAASNKNIDDAEKQLAALAKQLGDTAKDQPLAQELERAAAEQRKLAEAMQQHPGDKNLQAQQKALEDKLNKIVKENPEFQKPAEDANQGKQDALVKQIQQLEQAQKPLDENLDNQAQAAATKNKEGDMAQRQEDLNRELEQFKQQEREALRQAAAKDPEKSKMDPIVKDLKSGKLDPAAQAQRSAAVQMDDAASKLENAEKLREEQAAGNPKPDDQPQAAKDAAAMQQQANDLHQQIDQAKADHNPPTRPSDPANQQAIKLADELKKDAQAAEKTPGQSAAEHQARQEASRAADAAKRDAARGDAEAAQRDLAQGAEKLAAAAQEQQQADAQKAAGQKSMAQAAANARDLADRQQALADETAKAGQSLDAAADAKDHNSETAQQQKALAEKMDQTQKDAHSLQDQTQSGAPEMAGRAAKAAQAIKDAAAAQRAAAKATENGDAAQGAQGQDQTADKLATAEEALTGKPSASRQQHNGQQDPKQQTASANKPQSQQDQQGQQSQQGQQGQSGQQGQQGQSGQQGQQGQSDQQGQQGQSGQQGQQGQAGQQGQQAQQGQSGQQGQQDQSGQQGQQGQSGQQGQQAQQGQSGQQGQQGQSGQQGQQGQSGQQGQQAQQGQSGQQGQQGQQGQSGQQGQQGQSGQQAQQGQSGQQGQQAQQGQSGHQGQQGQQGQSGQQGQGTAMGQGQAQGTGQAAGTGQGTASGSGQPGQPGQGTAGQPGKSVAQEIQSARNAQERAANGDPSAAREAADDLGQASQQVAGGQTPTEGAGQSPSGEKLATTDNGTQGTQGAPGQQPGAGTPGGTQGAGASQGAPGQGAQPGGAKPGGSGGQPGAAQGTPTPGSGSGNGVTLTQGGPQKPPPQAVQDIGLSPSEWAKLPPNMQEQLLHSAQQSGPPSYHDMIKNYYSRIARLQSEEPPK